MRASTEVERISPAIAAVTDDVENLRFNRAVAQIYTLAGAFGMEPIDDHWWRVRRGKNTVPGCELVSGQARFIDSGHVWKLC